VTRRCICVPAAAREGVQDLSDGDRSEHGETNGTPLAGRYEKMMTESSLHVTTRFSVIIDNFIFGPLISVETDQIMMRQVGSMEHNLQKYNDLQKTGMHLVDC